MSRLEGARFGLRAFVTAVLVTVPVGRWAITGEALPEWAVAGVLGSAAAAGAFEAWQRANGR